MTVDRAALDRVLAAAGLDRDGRAARAELAERARDAGVYPVFVAPPELPDVEAR